MKKGFRKMATQPFTRKFFIVYILSVVLFTLVTFGSLLGVVAHYLSANSTQSAEKILHQLVAVSDYLKEDADNLSSLVATRATTISFMSGTREDKLVNYRLYQELNSYKANHPYLVDISVVNLTHGTSVQASGTNVNGRVNVALAENLGEENQQILRRTVRFYDPAQEYQVISFLYRLPGWHSVVIVDVDVERFNFSLEGDGENGHRVAVVDSAGSWIEYPEEFPLTQLEQAQVLGVLEEQGQGQDFFVYEDQEGQRVLYFSRSRALDWWFIDAQSYPQFLNTYGTLGAVFLGLMLLFLTASIVMSLVFTRQMRKPLVRLVERLGDPPPPGTKLNEIQYLERFLGQMEHQRYLNDKHLDSLYLSGVLFGRESPFFLSEQGYGDLREKYASPYYGVLLLKLWPGYEIAPEEREREYSLLRYTIGNLAEEIFSDYCRCYASGWKGEYTALLLLLPSPQADEGCRRRFQTLKECAAEHLNLRLGACLGPVVSRFDDIAGSCGRARDCLAMDNFVKPGDFVDTENITPPSQQEKNRALVDQVEQYTVANYGNSDLSLKGISKEFGLSAAYLGKVFKSVKGEPYHLFLSNVRMEQAKRALRDTNKTVVEISAQVGFSNATYFATVFKNTFGMTPSAYRGKAKSRGREKG